MSYNIVIRRSAQKSLSKLPKKDYERVRDAVWKLAENPRPNGYLKLTNRDGYRIRVGNYRIIYEINDNRIEIIILLIGHRKDIYD